jgi:hypothetical protein
MRKTSDTRTGLSTKIQNSILPNVSQGLERDGNSNTIPPKHKFIQVFKELTSNHIFKIYIPPKYKKNALVQKKRLAYIYQFPRGSPFSLSYSRNSTSFKITYQFRDISTVSRSADTSWFRYWIEDDIGRLQSLVPYFAKTDTHIRQIVSSHKLTAWFTAYCGTWFQKKN